MVAPDPRMFGSSGTQGTDTNKPVDRVNRVYAVYMTQSGKEYVAPAGKPKNPQDTMISTGALNADEAEQLIKSRRSDLEARAFRTSQPTDPRMMGSSGQQGVSTVPSIAQAENNMGTAVENVVNGVDRADTSTGETDFTQGTDALLGSWLEGVNGMGIQEIMGGTNQVQDPRAASNLLLDSMGLNTHSNRGFLEQSMSNYAPLWSLANVGGLNDGSVSFEDPGEALMSAGNLATNMMGTTGGTATRVDSRRLYDNIFSDAFAEYQGGMVDQSNAGPQGSFQRLSDSLEALRPYMGQQNYDHLMSKLFMAYEQFNSGRYKDPTGMDPQYQDFLQYLKTLNPQGWY